MDVALISVGKARRWQLPKGTVDPGETAEIAALREVREETGLQTELLDPLGTIEYWFYTREVSRVRVHKFVHFFLLRFVEGDTRNHDDEVNEAQWFEISRAAAILSFTNEREIVEKARQRIEAMG